MTHKQILMTTIAAVVIAAMGIFAGCKKEKENVKVTNVSVCPTDVMLSVGNNADLSAKVLPSNADNLSVTWKSDKPSVATVDGGTVTAVAIGEATITCTTNDGGFTAKTTVIVNPPKDDDDYATLVPSFYFGNMTMNGETVGENNLITVKYNSLNKISFSVDEKFKVPQMQNMEVPIKVDCISDEMTKEENGYKAEGVTTATLPVLGALPVKIDAVFNNNNLDMNIHVELPAAMGGNTTINFKGLGNMVINPCALPD